MEVRKAKEAAEKAEDTAAIEQPEDSNPIVKGTLLQEDAILKPCPYVTNIAVAYVGPEDSRRAFYVHEGILRQSPSLGSMFDQESAVVLVDTDPTVFELALRFLYAGDYYGYNSTTVSVYWSRPSSLAWRFEMHSLLYCFAEAHQIQSLSQLASQNFQSTTGVSYPDVLEVAKKVYKKLPQDDLKYREKFKDETRAAMNQDRNLFQELWILDVFRTESGHLTLDLYTTLTEPLIGPAPEIASINGESQTSDNPQNRGWQEPLTPSPTEEKRSVHWRESASPSPGPESAPDDEADIPPNPEDPESPTKQPSPTSDWDFWDYTKNTKKALTAPEEQVDEFPAADSHLAMPSPGSTAKTHKPKIKKKGKARKKSAGPDPEPQPEQESEPEEPPPAEPEEDLQGFHFNGFKSKKRDKARKKSPCLDSDPEPQPEQEPEPELLPPPPAEPEEDPIYFEFNTSKPYPSPPSEEEYPTTNFAHGEKKEKEDLSLVLEDVPPEEPPYESPSSSPPRSPESLIFEEEAGKYLSKPCSRRAAHRHVADGMNCVRCRMEMERRG
ncbi:hypothetical protein FQN50_000683 [Emmonsiellopsis sp. PD_5]|nr:hypothetical protein FQN50_000683 [Emmonsiellopsis sp. PD_5]